MRNSLLSAWILVILSICAMPAKAKTLVVASNSTSGIEGADYVGTLTDGTVLGFRRSGSTIYFYGAKTDATSLEVPDSIFFSGSKHAVTWCGYGNYNKSRVINFDEATNVTSLTLPSTIKIICFVPSQIFDLHLKSTTPPTLWTGNGNGNHIFAGTAIWVPQSVYSEYVKSWSSRIIYYEGWEPISVTVTVNSPGTFAQVFVSQVKQWLDVAELTVIGKLNDTDMAYFSRLKNVSKIDLTQTDIKSIKGCQELKRLRTILLPSTVVDVQPGAFNRCYCLREISLPNAASIGGYAFSGCSSLSSVSFPVAASIGRYAFSDCSSLSSVTLPTTLQELGDGAFYECPNLEDVYCYVVSPFNTTAFSNTDASATTLHVPAFSVSAYILHDYWYKFNEIVALEGNMDKISIISDFTMTELTGLAEKADLSVDLLFSERYSYYGYRIGHLTVSANEKWTLGSYVQSHILAGLSHYDADSGIGTTIIPYNEMAADNVVVNCRPYQDRWNFISFPFDVNVSDIIAPEGALWVIRKYSGEDRARMTGNTWQNMTDGMTLRAGEGYILHYTNSDRDSENWFTFKAVDNSNKNNIFAYQDVTKPLATYTSDLAHNRSWNLIGNPYPCYYDTRSIEHNGVITVWNGQGYTACSLLDDNYVLRPHEAFFVQCPADATSMKFKADGRQHHPEANGNASYARAYGAMGAGSRRVYNLTLAGADYTDKTRIVINEAAKLDYEISCDASKFMSGNTAVPQIYILENGQQLAIDERPLSDGTIALGTYFGQAGDYTIALPANPDEDMHVMLTDKQTNTTVDLTEDSYRFSAAQGVNDTRFVISITNNPTGIGAVMKDASGKESTIYNLKGQQLSAPRKGINIVNGNKTLVK